MQNLTNAYHSYINSTLDGKFCSSASLNEQPSGFVNLNHSYFKNNLKATNWYYGSTTASDYKIYLFKRSATYNLTDCPLATPFVGEDQSCLNCPPNSFFNLGSSKCDSCSAQQILNINSGVCEQCQGEQVQVQGTLICQPCQISRG